MVLIAARFCKRCWLWVLMLVLRRFSAGEAGSAAAAAAGVCWLRPALPMLLVVSGPAGGTGYDGFCWSHLLLLVRLASACDAASAGFC